MNSLIKTIELKHGEHCEINQKNAFFVVCTKGSVLHSSSMCIHLLKVFNISSETEINQTRSCIKCSSLKISRPCRVRLCRWQCKVNLTVNKNRPALSKVCWCSLLVPNREAHTVNNLPLAKKLVHQKQYLLLQSFNEAY